MKKYVKTILLLLSFVLLTNCEKENLDYLNEISESIKQKKLTEITFTELISNVELNRLNKKIETHLDYNLARKSSHQKNDSYSINTSKVNQIIDSSYISFTLNINNPNLPKYEFQNLLIEKNEGQDEYKSYIFHYIPDNNYITQVALSNNAENIVFSGEVIKKDLNDNVIWKTEKSQAKSGGCSVYLTIYHIDETGQEYEMGSGDLCENETGTCGVIYEYTIDCSGGGGNSGGGTDDGGFGEGGFGEGGNNYGNNGFDNSSTSPINEDGSQVSVVDILKLQLPNLNVLQIDWLYQNQLVAMDILEFLYSNDISDESVSASYITIEAFYNYGLNIPNYPVDYSLLDYYLDADMTDPATLALYIQYFSMECAILKSENSNWPDWKIYLYASKEMIHISLDIAGMTPGVGIVFDVLNGLAYSIEGDGINATISFASGVPIVGQWFAGARIAKKVVTLTNGNRVFLKSYVKVNNLITFSNRGQLRKILGINNRSIHAHHLVPYSLFDNPLVQKAAKSNKNWHINDIYNGIEMPNSLHLTGHSSYLNKVEEVLNVLNSQMGNDYDGAYDSLIAFNNYLKSLISNNPSLNSGQIANLISYP
tara:strand:+ start:589317 stop:591101 length:1785 start_codon:yes stop_codon:yes gene_type:complete